METKHLYRSRRDRIFLGVCGGLGEYFEIDALIFRALFALLSIGGGAGLVLYFVLAALIPSEPMPGVSSAAASYAGTPAGRDEFKSRVNGFAKEVRGNAERLAEEVKARNREYRNSGRYGFGLFIVILGVAWLLQNIFPQAWFHWHIFWPAVLILFGLMVMLKRK